MGKVYVVGIPLVWGGISIDPEELDDLRLQYGQSITSSIGYAPVFLTRADAEFVAGEFSRATGDEAPVFELDTFEHPPEAAAELEEEV